MPAEWTVCFKKRMNGATFYGAKILIMGHNVRDTRGDPREVAIDDLDRQ